MTNEATGAGSYFDYYGKSPSGVEIALRVDIDPGKKPAEIVEYLRALDSELAKAKFTRSDRLDKPAYGGGRPGAARPEEQPPADLVIPEHCGEPMVYHGAYQNKNGKDVGARWTCRQGKACAEPETRDGQTYPATNWHMTKKATDATTDAEAKPDAKPVNWTPFWRECTGLGVAKEEVWRIAGVTTQLELLAKVKTPEKLDELLARVKRARPAA